MVVIQLAGTEATFKLEAEVIPLPYDSNLGDLFRDYVIEGARVQLEEGNAATAALWFLMPAMDLPLEVAHASGFIPVNEFLQSEESKNQLTHLMHRALSTLKAFFTVFISEVWMTKITTQEERNQHASVQDMPGSQEGLAVSWDRRLPGGAIDSHLWIYHVHRKEDGKVALGERKEMKGASGRFASFLPPLESEVN